MQAQSNCRPALQQQQQQQQQQQEQQHDWEAVLKQTLIGYATAPGMPATLPRTLHVVSRGTRDAACATVRHLSLSRYQQGREAAQRMLKEAGEPVTSAMAAAAAAPPIPWDLLAATPSLTSLDMRGDQLEPLVDGEPPAAAAAAATAEASRSTAAQSATAAAVGPGVLSTTLGRLRRLRVVELKQVSQLAHLGRLLAGTTQLTQLVMLWDGGVTLSGGQLLEGLKAAAAGPGTTAAAAAASTLPPLRHLEVEGLFDGLLPAWLECPQAAAHFTTLKRTKWAAVIAELRHLPACSGLQELVVQYLPKHIPGLPQDLTRLTALTRLELIGMPIKEIPPVVWGLTSLRQLEIYWEGAAISSDISQLRQLRSLSLEGGEVKQLPADLGTWLPHLEELNMSNMRYASPVPRDVTRLTRLTANYTKIRRVSALTHLVTLKELEIEGCRLRPPLQPLTRLSALETLVLGWAAVVEEWEFALSRQEAEQVCVPALPALRSLRLSGWVPRRADQLSAVAQQLTHLKLYASLRPGVAAALEQLGVMPQLQQLELGAMSLECGGCYFDSLPPAAAQWLQQQPALTRLKLVSCKLAGPHLLQLPGQLEELDIERSRLVEPTPAALPQLSRLHKLTLYTRDHQQLPPWLSSLSRLEELSVQCSQDTTGWEVLGQLPALRRLRAVDFSPHKLSLVKHALPHVPHLCWSPA